MKNLKKNCFTHGYLVMDYDNSDWIEYRHTMEACLGGFSESEIVKF